MTAAYEIPIHLLSSVRAGVILAADVVKVADGNHYGRTVLEVADEWYAKVVAYNRHEDLLKPAEAESLLAVLEVAIKHAIKHNYEGTLDPGGDEADYLMFALRSDEIREALREIIYSNRLVFA